MASSLLGTMSLVMAAATSLFVGKEYVESIIDHAYVEQASRTVDSSDLTLQFRRVTEDQQRLAHETARQLRKQQ